MSQGEQLTLTIINHEIEGSLIQQRAADGYVNATAMCRAVGKKFGDYTRLNSSQDFLLELSSVTGIPVTDLIISIQGGRAELQGSWVHPDVAINLGQWLSPKFAVAVARWVREWVSGKFTTAKLPYHLDRYMANRSEIPYTHFSMLNELTFALIAPLEDQGYTLPEQMVPDISEGRMFSAFLREKGVETSKMPTYKHRYADGRVVDARLYPNSVLAMFRTHFNEVWLPQKCLKYFQERDPKALPFLQKVLPSVQFKQLSD